MAFHDLTTRLKPPLNLRSLLGLNLKFIPNPPRNVKWETFAESSLQRFNRDLQIKTVMAGHLGIENYNPKMYLRSEWTPPAWQIPVELTRRLDDFKTHLKPCFKSQKCPSNLLLHQQRALQHLRNQKDFLIVQCDKNLGPAIIERDEYIQMALQDHLQDRSTYRRLSLLETRMAQGQLRILLSNWIEKHKAVLSKNERNFLHKSLTANKDAFGYFYLLMKVHKSPLASRPIISGSGSLLHPLGIWVDSQLQRFAKRRQAYFSSSQELKRKLDGFTLPSNCFLFTADAVSMYTNIPTRHALDLICSHIRETSMDLGNVPTRALCEALKIVMTCNIFQFGDTHWKQVRGTSMGAPPAPPWANLYYSICEERFLPRFSENLMDYSRFIDDVLGIWMITDAATNDATWNDFCQAMNDTEFSLEWIVSPLSQKVDYMDLTITIQGDKLVTTLFEKASNFHLYIPPHSCHPPGLLRGMVFGMMNRIFTLCSSEDDQRLRVIAFFRHLQRRGYQVSDLKPLFSRAILRMKNRPDQATRALPTDTKKVQFLHLEYHPRNVPACQIRATWNNFIAFPSDREPLSDLRNENGYANCIDRLIVANHRPPNLSNLLSYRKIRPDSGPSVSEYLS